MVRPLVSSIMLPNQKDRRPLARIRRALIEVAFIVFLFYSNLLMGEFTAINGHGKTLAFTLNDIFTVTNFSIAMISAMIGHAVFHSLRKWL
ncbi:MAG: hypothetical protein ACLP7O_08515 [Terracidiphilus sp.]